MKMFSRPMAGLMVLAVLVLLLGIPTSSVCGADKEITVAVMLPNVGDTYFQLKWYGYSDEAKKLGVKAIMYDAGGYANVARQIQQVEDVIQKRVDAIIYHPCDSKAGIPVIEEAIKAGIKVINDNQPCPSPLIKHRIMRDFDYIGRSYAQWIATDSKGKGKVIILPGPVGGEQNILLLNGQKAFLRRWPNIKILDVQFCESNSAAGLKVAEDMLQAHPDVQYFTTFGDLIAQGVVQALRAAGKKPGEVKVLAFNMNQQTERLFREGWISVISLQEPVWMARKSMQMAVGLVKGEPVEEYVLTTDCLVTPETLDQLDWVTTNSIPKGWKP